MDLSVLLSKDFLRLYLVLIHILASTMAVGTILYSYVRFFSIGYLVRERIPLEHKIISISLLILILSGAAIVYMDVGFITSFAQLFLYKKLTTKLLIVLILLGNGFLIHSFIIPTIMNSSQLSRKSTIIFCASAAVSLTCWLSAIIFGEAVILKDFLSLQGFIMLFLTALFTGLLIGIIASRFITIKIMD